MNLRQRLTRPLHVLALMFALLSGGFVLTAGLAPTASAAPSCGVLAQGAAPEAVAAVAKACGLIGTAYSWGGGHAGTPGPTYGQCDPGNGAPNDCHVIGLDCSGMVRYAYYLAVGADIINGATGTQWNSPRAVARFSKADGLAPLLPGDLLFYGPPIHHVAMYLGNGYMVESPNSGGHVQVSTAMRSDYYGAIRLYNGSSRPKSASLSGDGMAEITATLADGSVKAWYNARGFAEMPWGSDTIVATGMDPARTFFADLDGDGRKEIINIQPNGDAKAWYNARGFAEMPWGASTIVGTGIDPARTYFADLDGDGRAEIMAVLPDGSVKAWHNDRGFAEMPWGANTIIATGMDPARTKFADLDGDGRAEITTTLADGSVKAWYNARGFSEMPWGASAIVATGMDPAKTFFADIDGDGRAEIANVQANGDLKAWYNARGFAEMPWGASTVIGTGIDPARTILA